MILVRQGVNKEVGTLLRGGTWTADSLGGSWRRPKGGIGGLSIRVSRRVASSLRLLTLGEPMIPMRKRGEFPTRMSGNCRMVRILPVAGNPPTSSSFLTAVNSRFTPCLTHWTTRRVAVGGARIMSNLHASRLRKFAERRTENQIRLTTMMDSVRWT